MRYVHNNIIKETTSLQWSREDRKEEEVHIQEAGLKKSFVSLCPRKSSTTGETDKQRRVKVMADFFGFLMYGR